MLNAFFTKNGELSLAIAGLVFAAALQPACAAPRDFYDNPSELSARPRSADRGAEDARFEIDKRAAAALLNRGESQKAYESYMRLFRQRPDDAEVNIGLARAAVKVKRYNQALMAYENMIERHPAEAVLYGEIANVYMLLGERQAAERSLAMYRSLDKTTTADQSGAALDAMQKSYSDFQARGGVRAGLQYDTNANQGPGSNDITIGGLPLHFADAKAKPSSAAYLGADVDMQKRFFRDSSWYLVGDARVFWKGYQDKSLGDINARYSQWGRAAAGARYLGERTLGEVRAKADIFDYEFSQNVKSYGGEALLMRAAAQGLYLILKGSGESRKYSDDSSRNGSHYQVEGYAKAVSGEKGAEMTIGGKYQVSDAELENYDSAGYEGLIRFLFRAGELDISPWLAYSIDKYDLPATVLETDDREDKRLKSGLNFAYHINKRWTIELGYSYAKNKSNNDLYSHKQHVVNLGGAWEF